MNGMDPNALALAAVNEGGPIPATDPTMLRRMVEARRALPPDKRESTAIGMEYVRGGAPDQLSPEGMLGLMLRASMADALLQRGYFAGGADQEKLYLILATIPFDKEDFAEACSGVLLAKMSEPEARKFREELESAGRSSDEPGLVKRIQALLNP